ncbi:MAG TPA: type IV secretory system conjugative DNA transfer family protein [Urbifossiella sp.]|nr:type IV secretory system conjugative DNA transfer family protein [Urbifossiella sp.]
MRDDDVIKLLAFVGLLFLLMRYARRGRDTSLGSAMWMTERMLKRWRLLTGRGLVIGRSLGDRLLSLQDFNHCLIVGPTGSGKSAGVFVVNLRSWFAGSVVAFDPTLGLYRDSADFRRKRRQPVFCLTAEKGGHALNPFQMINPATVMDDAMSLACAVVPVDPNDKEKHFSQRGRQTLRNVIAYVNGFPEGERNLSTVHQIMSSPKLLFAVGGKLAGGPLDALGGQILGLFENGPVYSREGASVIATILRQTCVFDSPDVVRATSSDAFPLDALFGNITVYIHIPPHLIEAHGVLLRIWFTALAGHVCRYGSERRGRTLLLIDEASGLGPSLPAAEETLVRGRAAGARLCLGFQSDAQVNAAFPDKKGLIYDNTSVQAYFGAASYDTADLISKRLGDFTQSLTSHSGSDGSSSQPGQAATHSHNRGWSTSVQKRALLDASEVLRLSNEFLIAFVTGLPAPILGRRIRWFEDPAFVRLRRWQHGWRRRMGVWFWIVVATLIALYVGSMWFLRTHPDWN